MQLGKLTALTGVILLSIAVIFGCSDDKKTVTPTVTYGSLEDPEFVPVKTQIDDAVTTLVDDILGGLDNLYVAPGDTTSVQNQLTPPAIEPDPEADPDVIITIYENGWHFVFASYTSDTYYAEMKDSVQFRIDGDAVQQPSSSVDYIHYIDNWTFTSLNQDITHIDLQGRNEFELANLDTDMAVINGTTANNVDTYYIDGDTTMTSAFAFDITVTDLNISRVAGQWISACPQAGVLEIALENSIEWSNGTSNGTADIVWDIEVTFNSGSAVVYASNGSTVWRYECDVCTIPVDL